jgi:hypothetical protein
MPDPTLQPAIPILRREIAIGDPAAHTFGRALRGLPWAFDDLTRDFGDDIYERMQLDAQVIACVNILRASIIEEGLRISSCQDDEAADGYALAAEIAGFCESVLGDLLLSLDDVLWDMLSAIALGSRVAEEVWDLVPATSYALPGTSPVKRTQDLLVLTALKPRPRHSTAFVVDAYNNVQGLLARTTTGGGVLSSGTFIGDAASVPNLFPRDKFAVLTFRPEHADPRGRPALRPAYTAWFAKMEIWQEFLRYLAQFASASVYAVASEDATKNGILVNNGDGTTTRTSAVEVLRDTLLAYKNGSVLAVPYGTILGALAVAGNGEAFHAGFELCDTQITMSILNQTLATREAKYQARASSETHQNTLVTLQRQAKRAVCAMLRRDVLKPLVGYNYGAGAARMLCPMVSLGEVEQFDFAATATAIAQLARASYIDPIQYAGIDSMLNLPPRDPTPPTPYPPEGGTQGGGGGEETATPMDEGDDEEDMADGE